MSDGELRQTMQRLMSIHDEIDEKKLDLKTVYADAKSAGFDKAALGLAIRQIRGRDKAETPAAEERAAIVDLYVSAFDNAPRTYVHVPAREAAVQKDPSGGDSGSAVRAGAPELPGPKAAPTVPSATFLAKPYDLRPHCLNRDNCGSYGSKHCGARADRQRGCCA